MEGETEATPELQEATCRRHPGSPVWCHWWGKGVGTPFSDGDTRGVYLLLTLCQLLLLVQLLLPFHLPEARRYSCKRLPCSHFR